MKTSSIVILFMIVSAIIPATAFTAKATASLQVTFAENPIIAAPGANDYIEVILEAAGGGIDSIDISASSWDPGAVIQQGNWDVYVGDLNAGESTSILFEFEVPSTASSALCQVVFLVEHSSGVDIKQTAIVRIEDQTSLDLSSVTPTSINIGEVATLVFNITNNGGQPATNVLFTWEDTNDLILPVGSDNRITISSIAAHNFTEIPVDISASPSITAGIYPLSIAIEYYDSTSTKQTITSTVGIQVGGTTDFEIVLQQSTVGTTSFAIANIGANVASSVIVSIPQQMNYVASGASSVSLGNLDAGDYTLASFQLSSFDRNNTERPPFNGNPPEDMPSDFGNREGFMNRSFGGFGDNNLIVEISYTDLFGVRQTVQKEVMLSSIASGMTDDLTSRFGTMSGTRIPGQSSESGNGGMAYIVVGVVGIIVIIAILKTGKSKNLLKLIKKGKNK